jgi:hypothetical protein
MSIHLSIGVGHDIVLWIAHFRKNHLEFFGGGNGAV